MKNAVTAVADRYVHEPNDTLTSIPGEIRGSRTQRSNRFWLLQLASVVVVGAGLYLARTLILPILIAVLLTLLLGPAVAGLKRLRIPEPIGAILVLVLLVSALFGTVSQLYEPAQRWLQMSDRDLVPLRKKLADLRRPVEAVKNASDKVTGMAGETGKNTTREVVVERSGVLAALGPTQEYLTGVMSCFILLYFLLASGDLFLRKLVRILPTFGDKKTAVEIIRAIQSEIGSYFLTVSAVNLLLGLVTAAVMYALGMPNPLLWGVMVGVLNFIPYIGPLTSLVVLSVVAVISFDSWQQILPVPAAFAAITLIEGNFVQPIVVGRRLEMNPVVIFLAVLLGGWFWSIGGILLAVPVLVTLKICADHLPALESFGQFIGHD